MKRILLSKAIKDESIYMINNNSKIFSQPYYNSINGRVRFVNLKKINLSDYNLKGDYQRELLQNPLVCIEIEYINLNQTENSIDIFENNCNLIDLDGYSFKVFSTKGYNFRGGFNESKEIYRIFNLPDNSYYGQTDLIPKIKQTLELFFIVPDEETDYYFEIVNGIIEEI